MADPHVIPVPKLQNLELKVIDFFLMENAFFAFVRFIAGMFICLKYYCSASHQEVEGRMNITFLHNGGKRAREVSQWAQIIQLKTWGVEFDLRRKTP